MNGRIYGMNRSKGLVAIETEFHGFTIVELVSDADLQVGDEITWESDTQMGLQTYSNVSTNRSLEVNVHNHLVAKTYLRQLIA